MTVACRRSRAVRLMAALAAVIVCWAVAAAVGSAAPTSVPGSTGGHADVAHAYDPSASTAPTVAPGATPLPGALELRPRPVARFGVAAEAAVSTRAIAVGHDLGAAGGGKALADATGASWYKKWAADGITRRTVDNRFGRAFHQAVGRADEIHFSLDGIDDVGAAVAAGRRGFVRGNITNAELRYIANNPGALSKTIFYRGGTPVASPFGWRDE